MMEMLIVNVYESQNTSKQHKNNADTSERIIMQLFSIRH